MQTLFQFVTLDNWAAISRMVTAKNPYMQIFFIAYIIVTAFTILSLLTGVVSEHILKVTKNDEDELKKQQGEELKKVSEEMLELFKKADTDNSGTIGRSEFK